MTVLGNQTGGENFSLLSLRLLLRKIHLPHQREALLGVSPNGEAPNIFTITQIVIICQQNVKYNIIFYIFHKNRVYSL